MNPKVRPVAIRGKPEEEARIYNNWFAQDKSGEGQRSDVRGPMSEGGGEGQRSDVGGQMSEEGKTEGRTDEGTESRVFFYNNAFGRPNPVVIE
jgi:hypothetical protein